MIIPLISIQFSLFQGFPSKQVTVSRKKWSSLPYFKILSIVLRIFLKQVQMFWNKWNDRYKIKLWLRWRYFFCSAPNLLSCRCFSQRSYFLCFVSSFSGYVNGEPQVEQWIKAQADRGAIRLKTQSWFESLKLGSWVTLGDGLCGRSFYYFSALDLYFQE